MKFYEILWNFMEFLLKTLYLLVIYVSTGNPDLDQRAFLNENLEVIAVSWVKGLRFIHFYSFLFIFIHFYSILFIFIHILFRF